MIASPERMLKIAQRMDIGDDGSIPSFIAMTKILHDLGTTWHALVAHAIEQRCPSPTPRQATTKTNVVDINDWLATIPKTEVATHSPEQQTLSGIDVPAYASGIISIIEERTTRAGSPMLLVSIENNNAAFGPVAVFNKSLIDAIKNGHALSGVAHIDPPARSHLYPILTQFEDARTPRAA